MKNDEQKNEDVRNTELERKDYCEPTRCLDTWPEKKFILY